MRILITGSEGYIGSVMIPVLQAAGHDLVGVDTCYFDHRLPGQIWRSIPVLVTDVRELQPPDLRGFDAVVHLAALSNDPMGDLNPELTYEINFRASVRLAEIAKLAGVQRFVFASSCSVYGAGSDGAVAEDGVLAPLTAYAISKVRTEEAVSKLADEHFSPVFMRNATAYGVSPRLRIDLVLNNLTGWAYTTGSVKLLSDGTPWRPLVHVEDICGAVAAVIEAPRQAIHNQSFNVGANAENHQIRSLAEIVRQTVPGCTVEYAGSGEPDRRSYRVDFAKIGRHVPAFQPRWTAHSGAEQLYRAYRTAELAAADLQSPRYVRLKQLQQLISAGAIDAGLRWEKRAAA